MKNGPDEEPVLAEAANYGYDTLSRRSRLVYGNETAVDYAYNLNGNVTALSHQWTGDGATLEYAYDKTGLQTAYSSSDDRFAPIFEALGSRTNAPNNLNQYVTAAGKSLAYDGNGNLTGDGTRTFSYDAANRMIAAQTSHTVNYAYDPFDRRNGKTVDGQATTFIYDGNQIIAEYDGSGLAREFVYGLGIDEPIMMEVGTDRYFYHANTLGSIVSLTNSTGNVAEAYRYSVYGQADHAGNVGNPYLFTGRQFDAETGLYYYRARYYDAGLRRFLQTDPIKYSGGMGLYTYVGNGPINWVDPFGLETILITTWDNSFGSHSALLIINEGVKVLYDPAGTYTQDGTWRPPNGVWAPENLDPDPRDDFSMLEVNIGSYMEYHKEGGSTVTLTSIPTSPSFEKVIIRELVNKKSWVTPMSCAINVSGVIAGAGPFNDVKKTRFPGTHYDQVQRVQGAHDISQEELLGK